MDDLKQLKEQYKEELLNNVLPFWIQHSQDKECGGYFTCLDQFGKVFDTDKFIWLQGREVGCFLCYIINWRKSKNGWTVPYKVANS